MLLHLPGKRICIPYALGKIPQTLKPKQQMQRLAQMWITSHEIAQANNVILEARQKASFAKQLSVLQANKAIFKNSPLLELSPTLEDNLICIWGRLKHSSLATAEKNPKEPKDSHVSLLLTRQPHQQAKDKGCLKEQSGQQDFGSWEARHKSIQCVNFRKLSVKWEKQSIAGLDVYGPWSTTTRRIRGGQAASKRGGHHAQLYEFESCAYWAQLVCKNVYYLSTHVRFNNFWVQVSWFCR